MTAFHINFNDCFSNFTKTPKKINSKLGIIPFFITIFLIFLHVHNFYLRKYFVDFVNLTI